jgi:hypothetical protein
MAKQLYIFRGERNTTIRKDLRSNPPSSYQQMWYKRERVKAGELTPSRAIES